MQLYYDPTRELIFASDEAQPDPIYEISPEQIPDLIANGAERDASVEPGKSDASPGDGDPTSEDELDALDPSLPLGDDHVGNVSGSTSSTSDAASSIAGSTSEATSSASASTPAKSNSPGDDHA